MVNTSVGMVGSLDELLRNRAIPRKEKVDVLLRMASEATARESGMASPRGDDLRPSLPEILSALHELEPNEFV